MLKLELAGIIVLVAVLSAGTAYAEVGKNYDRELLSVANGLETWRWVSHYERIDDGKNWVNYLQFENSTHYIFEGTNISFTFLKQPCLFNLYKPGHITENSTSVALYKNSLRVDGTPRNLACSVSVTPGTDSVRLQTTQVGSNFEVRTFYDIMAHGFVEWTYELDNHDMLSTKTFEITENCLNCNVKNVRGDIIEIDSYILDTKNGTHGALKSTDFSKGIELVYEVKNVGVFDEAKIDPVFSSNNPVEDADLSSTNLISNDCASTVSARSGTSPVNIFLNANSVNGACVVLFFEWDISSLPTLTIPISTIVKYEVTAVTNARNCDYIDMGNFTSSSTNQQLYNHTRTASTIYVSNDSTCTTVGTNKSETLGTVANTDIQTQVNTSDRFMLGMRFFNMVRDTVIHDIQICAEEAICTPDPTLEITYATTMQDTNTPVLTLATIGDVARITSSQTVNVNGMNITQMQVLVNNTVWKTNSTVFNFTSWPSTINYNPFWYQMNPNTNYDFEIQIETDPEPNIFPANQLSYFPFEDTTAATGLVDFGLEANHASMGAGSYATTTGQVGNLAIIFDSTNRVSVPNESDYDFERTQPFSVSYWVREQTQSDFNGHVIKFTSLGGTPGWGIFRGFDADQRVFCRLSNGTTQYDVTSTVGSIPFGVWTHVVCTYDGSSNQNGLRIYINGVLNNIGTATAITGSILGNTAVSIGGPNNFVGPIDDVRIFNRVLTATEAKQLYNLGTDEVSNISTTSQQYNPSYQTAINPGLGNVNYTISRINNQDTVWLRVNRDVNDTTFTMNCWVQNSVQTAFNSTTAEWNNVTSVAYANMTFPGFSTSHAYGGCLNPPADLFEFESFADSTLSLAAINVFDASWGEMIGVPVGVFFIVMVAGMANKRTAPTFIVSILAIAGAMAAIGFFSLAPIVWGLALVAGMLGLFVNQKIF